MYNILIAFINYLCHNALNALYVINIYGTEFFANRSS